MTYQANYQLLKFIEGRSNKFYRAYHIFDIDSGDHRVLFNWGPNGSTGQFQVLPVSNANEAAVVIDQKLGEKARKGYQEAGAGHLPVVSEDILLRAGVNVRSQPEKEIVLSLSQQVAVKSERAVRLLTGPAELQAEAVVLVSDLHQTLKALRREVLSAEGQIDMVDTLLRAKVDA